jgi:hypothetical protein
MIDRRALFFLGASVVCFVLTPLAEPAQRWVPLVFGCTYVVLAVASALDHWSRTREEP